MHTYVLFLFLGEFRYLYPQRCSDIKNDDGAVVIEI